MQKRFFLVSSILSLCFTFYKVQTADVDFILSSRIESFISQYQVPGVAVALYYQGREYVRTFGVAHAQKKNSVTVDTIFEIGSITKVFTSTWLALESLQGTTRIGHQLRQCLSYLRTNPNALNPITLQQLATHTSSLPLGVPIAGAANSEKDLVDAFAKWIPAYPIGTRFLYSNVGFVFLGHALQDRTGKKFFDAVKNLILNPLQMTSTFIQVPPALVSLYAQGYKKDGTSASRFTTLGVGSSGALRSSIKDMKQFLKANLNLIGSYQLKSAMQFAQQIFFRADKGLTVGLGWQRPLIGGIEFVNKEGGTAGFSSYIGMIPGKTMGIVLLVNKADVPTVSTGRAILTDLISSTR